MISSTIGQISIPPAASEDRGGMQIYIIERMAKAQRAGSMRQMVRMSPAKRRPPALRRMCLWPLQIDHYRSMSDRLMTHVRMTCRCVRKLASFQRVILVLYFPLHMAPTSALGPSPYARHAIIHRILLSQEPMFK